MGHIPMFYWPQTLRKWNLSFGMTNWSVVCNIPTDGPTDGLTDQRTDGQTDKASYRVACPQLISVQLFYGGGFYYASTNERFGNVFKWLFELRKSVHSRPMPDLYLNRVVTLNFGKNNYTVFKSKWQIVNLCSSKTTGPKTFKFSVNVGNNWPFCHAKTQILILNSLEV